MEKMKKVLVIILSFILAVSTTNVSDLVYATEAENDVTYHVADLDESIGGQEVPTGTELTAGNLPTSLSEAPEGVKDASVSAASGSAIILSKMVEAVEVCVAADEGVFPPGELTLDVTKIIGAAKEQEIEAAIEEQLEEKSIEQTISFDVRILDADGKEVQPDTTKGNVTVTFKNVNVELTDVIEVYHVADDFQAVEPVESEVNEGEVVFEAEHFSIYTIVFVADQEYTCSLSDAQTKLVKDIITEVKPAETVTSIESAISGNTGILSSTDTGLATKVNAVAPGATTLTVSYNTSSTITMDIVITSTFLGSGTEADPYQIGTPEQLILLRDYVNTDVTDASNGGKKYSELYYQLTQDIVLNEANIGSWSTWTNTTPGLIQWSWIGSNEHKFLGTLDGQGYSIRGMYMRTLCGFNAGTIKNLGIEQSYIYNIDNFTGCIADYNTGTISNCYSMATVNGGGATGGLVGFNEGTVKNCNFKGSITGYEKYPNIPDVGGIAGIQQTSGKIINCYNTGAIYSSSTEWAHTGGIVSTNYGVVENSYNTGALSGTVTGNFFIGGIVGFHLSGNVKNCYNAGAVTGSTSGTLYRGGIIGEGATSLQNNYYLTGTAPGGIGGTNPVGVAQPMTAAQFASGQIAYLLNNYSSFDTANWIYWMQEASDTAPTLTTVSDNAIKYCVTFNFEDAATTDYSIYTKGNSVIDTLPAAPVGYQYTYTTGATTLSAVQMATYQITADVTFNVKKVYAFEYDTDGTTILIDSEQDLTEFSAYVNAGNILVNAKLTQDIVLNASKIDNWTDWYYDDTGLTNWIPIGTESYKFKGSFDGENHSISGIYIGQDLKYSGLFGCNAGTIKNIQIQKSLMAGDYFIGGIVGNNFYLGSVENSSYAGRLFVYTSNAVVGGVAGINYGIVKNCYNEGLVFGNSYTGGVIGVGYSGSVIDCYNTGKVDGGYSTTSGCAGGIAGINYSGSITGCYNEGIIIGEGSPEAYAGGIVGKLQGTKIENCYNLGAVSGKGWGTGTVHTGGIVGYITAGTVKNTYTTGAVSVSGTGTLTIGGSFGRGSGTLANNYYLSSVGTGLNATLDGASKTAVQFDSGEVTWNLQQGQTDLVWGQDISSAAKDAFPVLSSDSAKKVCHLTLFKPNGATYSQLLYKEMYGNYGQTFTLEDNIGYSWIEWHGSAIYVGSIMLTTDTILQKTAKQINLSKTADSVNTVCDETTTEAAPLYNLTTAFTISNDSEGSTVTYTTADALPAGLSLNGGKIYGTPTLADASDTGTLINITVKGNNGSTVTFALTIHIAKAAPVITSLPTVSATYGTKVEDMTFTGGTVSKAGTWSWTDSNKSDIPQAGNTTSYEATFTPFDPSYGVVVRSITPTITKKPLTEAMLSSIAGQIYTGAPLTPVVTVTDGGDQLTQSSDYEISYSNNTNAGVAATVTITAAASGNYSGSVSKQFTISYLSSTGAYNITGTKPSGSEWYNNDVTITPGTGYTISTNAVTGYSSNAITVDTEGTNHVSFYLQNALGQKTAAVTAEIKLDKTAPTFAADQGIKISTNYWNTFLNTVTFGKYFTETQTVTISATDSSSGIEGTSGYRYYLSDSQLSLTQVQNLADSEWMTGNSFSVTPNHSYIIYAKITDRVGNACYISSNGIMLDSVGPTITELITPTGSNLGSITATAHITSGEAGMYYYIVTKTLQSYTAAEVKSGKSGSGILAAATSKEIAMTGLSANTEYYLSVVTQDAAGNLSTVSSTSFQTGKIQTSVTTLPTVSAVYGTKVEDMSFAGGTVNTAGTWSWTDSHKSDIPQSGNTTSYEATFTPADASYTAVVCNMVPSITSAVAGSNFSSNGNDNSFTIIKETVNDDGAKTTEISDKDGNIVSVLMQKDDKGEWIPAGMAIDLKATVMTIADGIAQLRVTFPAALLKYAASSVDTPVPLVINLPADIAKSLLGNQSVNEIQLGITLPAIVMESNELKLDSIILSKDMIKDIKEEGKSLEVSVNSEGNKGYSWSFDQWKAEQITDVNLWLTITADRKIEVNPESTDEKERKQGEIISFYHSGSLPATAHIKVYVAGDYGVSGIKAGSRGYLYYRNDETGSYDQLPNNRYTVDSEGYVTVTITHCSDYVLFSEKLEDNYTTNLLKQVEVSFNKKVLKSENKAANKCTLYLNGTTRKSGQIGIQLPDTLIEVADFKREKEDIALGRIKFSYTSSNTNIVKVSNAGKILVKKAGTATVTVKAELEDGSIQRYEIPVTVKKHM